MKKFKRNVDNDHKNLSKWVNSGQSTGFLNEKLLETDDRDFWKAIFRDVLTDPYTSSMYESVLIAWKEIPYTAKAMQDVILQNSGDKKNKQPEVFVSIDPNPCKIYRCVFSLSPVMSITAKIGSQIYNTLEKLKADENNVVISGEYAGFNVVPKVIRFFEKQLKGSEFNKDILQNQEDTLIIDSYTDIVVPVMVDGHYVVGGQDRRPMLGETFYHNVSSINQHKFIFKQKYKRTWSKYTAYFSKAKYTYNDYNKDIFYIKFFKEMYINPFMIFEEDEVEELVSKILNMGVKDETADILLNTYECYLREVDTVRLEHKNGIPTIFRYLEREDDEGFKEKKDRMLEEMESEDDYDEDFDDVVTSDEDNVENIENDVNVITRDKPFSITRNILTVNLLYKLIMGHDGTVYYSFYPHLENELLKIADVSKSGFRGENSATTIHPRGMQIQKTISSNADIMITNDSYNPIDIHKQVQLKKRLHDVDTNPRTKKKGSKSKSIPPKVKYRTLDLDNPGAGDYGKVDGHTSKSTQSAGIQSNGSTNQAMARYFLDRSDYEINHI